MSHLKKKLFVSLLHICLSKLLIEGNYKDFDLQNLCIGPICKCRWEIGKPANLKVRQHPAKTVVFNIRSAVYLEWFIDLCSLTSENRVSTFSSDRTGSMHVIHAMSDGISQIFNPPTPLYIENQTTEPDPQQKRKIFFHFNIFSLGQI